MVVKFNFRGTVNTLAGHKRNLANTKKRVDAVRKIQAAYRAALARRRKRAAAAAAPAAVVAKKPKQTKTKTKAKAKKPKTKKLVKSKVRALLKLNRPALEKKFQDVRKLAKELACSGDRNFALHDRRFGPKEIGKLGLTNRELVDMIRRTEQSCFGGYGISRIPTKQERKYFAGVNMSNNAKKNKNYVPNNRNNDRNNNDYLRALGWEHNYLSGLVPVNRQARNNFEKGNMTTGRIPKLPNEYIYANDAKEINNAEKNMVWNNFHDVFGSRAKQAKPAMNDAKLRAYLRNQIKARFGVDPNKNARFIRLENWRNYGNDPNASKVYQYIHTLKQPGKLAGKKRFGRGIYKTLTENWTGATVPTTRTGRRGAVAARPGVHQRAFAERILSDLDYNLNGYGNDNGWTKNLSENDKRYAKRMVNTHATNKSKIMTNAVANNIIKRFGKRAARAMRKETNKARANNVKRFVDNRLDGNWRPITTKKGQNEWLKGMGMAGR